MPKQISTAVLEGTTERGRGIKKCNGRRPSGMGEDFIGSEAPQLTVVLRRRRRRRIRRRRRRSSSSSSCSSSSSSSSSSRNRQRRQPMSKFHLQLLTFILEIR